MISLTFISSMLKEKNYPLKSILKIVLGQVRRYQSLRSNDQLSDVLIHFDRSNLATMTSSTYLPTYIYLTTYLHLFTYLHLPTYIYLPTYLPTYIYLPLTASSTNYLKIVIHDKYIFNELNDVGSHTTSFIQLEFFIQSQCKYAFLKFVYYVGNVLVSRAIKYNRSTSHTTARPLSLLLVKGPAIEIFSTKGSAQVVSCNVYEIANLILHFLT